MLVVNDIGNNIVQYIIDINNNFLFPFLFNGFSKISQKKIYYVQTFSP